MLYCTIETCPRTLPMMLGRKFAYLRPKFCCPFLPDNLVPWEATPVLQTRHKSLCISLAITYTVLTFLYAARNKPNHSNSHLRVSYLIVRLRQPFGAFCYCDGEFKKIAQDHNIIDNINIGLLLATRDRLASGLELYESCKKSHIWETIIIIHFKIS
ncbi:uncharacterized protein EDB93DRAFT_706909 [Suillus bovinus]|uniref:uncharacterized protein n=1 Tax=Suillus bovinus TaxID=48563 RepID=UPI001B85B581|nr:uncharacterized protein EDB93DRAFT_706909 [Suillus bovinus]KAG2139072.1 hypothetical protein EDB93DRAFT_706909 [Suillus bovinus]